MKRNKQKTKQRHLDIHEENNFSRGNSRYAQKKKQQRRGIYSHLSPFYQKEVEDAESETP